MTDLNVPNAFTSGTSIVAADMNANFDAIETLVNTTGVPAIQDGIVSAAKLASASVTAAKVGLPGVAVMTSIPSGGSQTLTAGAGDTLLVNSASGTTYDTGTITVTAGTARATVQRTGLYSVTGWAVLDPSSGTPTAVLYIKLNGSSLTTVYSEVVANASIKTVPTREVIMSLTSGDYLQMFGECATNNVVVEEAGFNVKYLGPAS